jgi:hypothetical protein
MLQFAKLSKSFWGETIAITCYFQNQSYTSIFSGKTPYECWRVKNLFFITSKCLNALLMPMSWMTHEENLSRNPFNVKLLDMVKMLEWRVINYTTKPQGNQSIVEMWYLMNIMWYYLLNPQMFLQLSFLCQNWNQIQCH